MRVITVTPNEGGQRLDRFLRKYLPKAPLAAVYRTIRKDLRVNGRKPKEGYVLREGDEVALYLAEALLEDWTLQRELPAVGRSFQIAYEDEDIMAAVKPLGLLIHGDAREKKDTLTNQVVSYLIRQGSYVPRDNPTFTPAAAHRLDRNTTGLVLFGKNAPALRALTRAFRQGGLRRFYYAMVAGQLTGPQELCQTLLKDEKTNRTAVAPAGEAGGKEARTRIRPLYSAGGFTLVEAELITGRSHQIRIQLQSAGLPILGDRKYGNARINRQLADLLEEGAQRLHAGRIELTDPPPPLTHLAGLVIKADLPASWHDLQMTLWEKEILLNGTR